MTRYLLGGIGLYGVALLQIVVIVLLLKFRGGYQKGREEGFELGFEAGRIRADEWWLKTIEQIDQGQREKIRNSEEDRRP